ncbi:7746_t:CDS:2, partial [Entrophospora sp. SA101]
EEYISKKFWECFGEALNENKKGQDGCIHVLSIIANKFTYTELQEKLFLSANSVTSARLYAKTNGPGCLALSKPAITKVKLSKESLDQFMTFLLDNNNTMPNLGGLCLTCNEYGFGVFEEMKPLVQEKINRKDIQNELITQLEKTQCHLNREYGNELIIDDLGNVQHDNCIEHCLNFAFEKDPNRLSKDVVKAELKKRKIEYEEKEKKVDDIDKLKSFGIQTSGLDVMYLKFPELYLYHEIMSFKFPETIQA